MRGSFHPTKGPGPPFIFCFYFLLPSYLLGSAWPPTYREINSAPPRDTEHAGRKKKEGARDIVEVGQVGAEAGRSLIKSAVPSASKTNDLLAGSPIGDASPRSAPKSQRLVKRGFFLDLHTIAGAPNRAWDSLLWCVWCYISLVRRFI